MPLKTIARFALPYLALLVADLSGAALLYKTANLPGQDALAYSGLITACAIFWFLGRKNGVTSIAPALASGLVVSIPFLVFALSTLSPSDDHVVYIAQLSPLCGALFGCNVGILGSKRGI